MTRRRWLVATSVVAVALALAYTLAPRRRPSILLVVFDTTRADAVSAYGQVRGTTPVLDALAAEGLRFSRAYAQANWTLPSHATMFTGRLPTEHGLHAYGARLADAQPTLAEVLGRAGYETVGISENPWINDGNGMTRGFGRFRLVDLLGKDHAGRQLRGALEAWLAERQPDRPFFLFLNLMNAHAPYEVRAENPFLPPGTDAAAAAAVSQVPGDYICRKDARARELAVLRGLYLGDVHAADARLAEVLALLRAAGLADGLITVVTADHGEHFGEHRLVLHDVGVREQLIHVPLVVHGLARVAPNAMPQTVAIADLMPTILGWAGAAVPPGLVGRPLPTTPDPAGMARAAVAEYSEPLEQEPIELPPALAPLVAQRLRAACKPEDRVFGDMRALVAHPYKLIWYANYPPELYDLTVDPDETRDLAADRPAVIAALMKDLHQVVDGRTVAQPGVARWEATPELVDRLRALGYVGGDGN